MKKSLFIIVLATVLVFSFATIAGAKYAGYSKINPTDGATNGYVAWSTALKQMAANSVDAGLTGTAHGGYVTATSKCATCHSAHRATGVPARTPGAAIPGGDRGPTDQMYLTSGKSMCLPCHVAWGGQATSKLVEWAEVGPGPHGGASRGCLACHSGGIHGGARSKYNVMNAYMLGAKGDAQLDTEKALLTRSSVLTVDDPATATTTNWWQSGTTGIQAGIASMGVGITNTNIMSAAKGVATSYTCTQAGCHTNTVMANTVWGAGFDRHIEGTSGATQLITGHTLPSLSGGSARGNNCSTCHTGSYAGFPASTTGNANRRAFGCDQCHDMVGMATNSTAFPHGNRNIQVYEWVVGVETSATVSSGNLWMYAGNIAGRDISNPQPSNFGNYYDATWKVMSRVVEGTNGGATYYSNETTPAAGGLVDGACLKCHVAIDPVSLAQGSIARDGMTYASAPNGIGRHGAPTAASPAVGLTGSGRVFLYK